MFRGVLRHCFSQNIDAITGTLQLNRFDIVDSVCCMYLTDRFSQLLSCEVALYFINTRHINDLSFITHSTCSTHRPMEITDLQIKPVYLFSKFSSLGNVYYVIFHTDVFIDVSLMS